MKFELIFSTSSDPNRVILDGKGPHKPMDTNDSTFKFESFERTVKKVSMENLSERVSAEFQEAGLILFPMMVSSVT